MELSALLFHNYIAPQVCFSIAIKVRHTHQEKFCITHALFLTVVLGWILSLIQKMLSSYVLIVGVNCLHRFCCVHWNTAIKKFWKRFLKTISLPVKVTVSS